LALATRVQISMLLGHVSRADDDSLALVELAEQLDLPAQRLRAQRLRAQVMSLRGDRLESRRLIMDALTMARQVGHHTEEALLQVALGEELWLSGAYAEAVGRYQAAAAAAATLGLSLPRTQSIRMVGRCYFMKGDYDRATGHLRAALEARDVHPHGGDDPVLVRGDLALALLAKNQLDDADVQLDAAIEFAQGAAAHIEASWRTVQGYLDTARSKDSARRAFVTAMWLCRGLARDYAFGEAATGLAMWYLRSGEPSRALRVGRMAERRFRALDAQGQLRRIAPLLNAADGLGGR
jgi:tetratricopeptide (TPR) repeat protein